MASKLTLLSCLLLLVGRSFAQLRDPEIDNIVKEEMDHSQLRALALDLFDRIGPRLQVVFNQDNGTGRVENLSGQGFLNSYDYLQRWLAKVPSYIRDSIKTTFPGKAGRGGSDFAGFVAMGAPAFSLSSLDWSYGIHTRHTNRDTYIRSFSTICGTMPSWWRRWRIWPVKILRRPIAIKAYCRSIRGRVCRSNGRSR
jgi:hypothetical protein